MLVTHLSLQHFRNYLALELDLGPGPTVLWGDNAQGKTNLLEAIYLLSTGRSARTTADREFITNCLPPGELPVTRIVIQAQRSAGPFRLEMALAPASLLEATRAGTAWEEVAGAGNGAAGSVQKRVRVNGSPKRLIDLIGQLPAVLFSPEDIELVTGAPAVRRRYLDITVAQLNPGHARRLQSYQRVVLQRNHLLRQIQEGHAQEQELAFWDSALANEGAAIVHQRLIALAGLAPLASRSQLDLSGGNDTLGIQYAAAGLTLSDEYSGGAADLNRRLASALESVRRREIAQGQTVIGPHRDDLRFQIGGMAAGPFGSRGQQRTTALALKLAEAEYLRAQIGEAPILLLDDAFSEMDHQRRTALSTAALSYEQVLITTAERNQLPGAFLADTARYEVISGHVQRHADRTSPLLP